MPKSIDFLARVNQAAEEGDGPLFDKIWSVEFITDATTLPRGLLKYFPEHQYRVESRPFPPDGMGGRVMNQFTFTRVAFPD